MWLETKFHELGVLRVVVMLFRLHSRIRNRDCLHVEPELLSCIGDDAGEIVDGELLRELVENSEFPKLGRVGDGDLDALNCVSDI